MHSPWIVAVVTLVALLVVPIAAFMIYVYLKYSGIVARIFEEKPLFLPLRVARAEDAEDVRFTTRDGLTLVGSYLKTRATRRAGVLVFCHEFLSDRWSVQPYLDHLRDHGFDLFTFDFRNHGESPHDPAYTPLQWVTAHEVADLQAAVACLRSRPDADPAGFGLFGVSRGGGTALCVAAKDPGAWGVVTDGAFPTRGTMMSYIDRWAKIYVSVPWVWKLMPRAAFEYLGWVGRVRTQRRLGCRYVSVERAAARLSPRPWLAIHGQKDAYIGVAIAEGLFRRAGEPKEFWAVAKAKHNRCRQQDPATYDGRILDFFGRYAPRRVESARPAAAAPAASPAPESPAALAIVDPVAFGPLAAQHDPGIPLPV